jgi:hypothetical protein
VSKEPKKEPGNRLGAAGLVLAAIGGGRLLFDVPPVALSLPRSMAAVMAIAGALLLLGGLLTEWRGPRRWSALLPGVAALALGGWLGTQAVHRARSGPRIETVTLHEGAHELVSELYSPRDQEVQGCVVLLGGKTDVSEATARALAGRGLVALRTGVTSDQELSRLNASLRAELSLSDCGVIVDGRLEEPAALLEAAEGFKRAVAVSMQAADRIMAPRTAVPTLYLFGGADGSGHAHASALLGQLARAEGQDDSVLRVFLGGDRDLLLPRTHAWRQPGVLAPGYADMLVRWILEGTA